MKSLTLLAILVALSTDTFAAPAASAAAAAQPEQICDVQVCNRIKRWSVNPFAHLGDAMGETCFPIQVPKSQAVVGKVLSSEHTWSINPTKKSVTTIKSVGLCR